mmetsp:Transcript_11249/g.21572  ORF Transcript_11249/g.21572 Transcript_11249/m.21572 type:complete len:85 (-) Transcript_11249:1885-2139(-)
MSTTRWRVKRNVVGEMKEFPERRFDTEGNNFITKEEFNFKYGDKAGDYWLLAIPEPDTPCGDLSKRARHGVLHFAHTTVTASWL